MVNKLGLLNPEGDRREIYMQLHAAKKQGPETLKILNSFISDNIGTYLSFILLREPRTPSSTSI